ncbi:MAG TPA: RRXRR domain-containing protein, partial [Ktedonobacterales bacterium]|nr:RRXRR domain-containing protein [Ktedonobacterales bacterium]
MSYVFVVDPQRKPLDPIHPGRARYLLRAGYAAVFRQFPFTIILKENRSEEASKEPTPLRLKLDPGSKTTGLAVVKPVNDTAGVVIFAAEISHRGQQIHDQLTQRAAVRHSRRSRHTRY